MWLHLYKYNSTGVAINRRERRWVQSCEIWTSSGILYWTSFIFWKINKMTNWWGRCGMQNTKRLKRETYLHRFTEVSVVVLVFKWACSNQHDIKSYPARPYISHLWIKPETHCSIPFESIAIVHLPKPWDKNKAYLAIIFAARKDLRWDISRSSSFRAGARL